jgi:hypothetical protein
VTGRKPVLGRAEYSPTGHDTGLLHASFGLFQGLLRTARGEVRTGPRIRAAGPWSAASRMRGSGCVLKGGSVKFWEADVTSPSRTGGDGALEVLEVCH